MTPRRTSRRPIPTGPWNLCALAASVAAPRAWKLTGIRPTACTASVWTGIPRAEASPASRATGWIAPVSLLASISVASRVRSSNAAAISPASARPWASTAGRLTRAPSASSRAIGSATAGCSMGEETRCPEHGSDPASPKIARLLASVPPDVKITSSGSAPRILATVSFAASHARRARRPAACRLSALPAARRWGRMASSTSGSSGVVALWSR